MAAWRVSQLRVEGESEGETKNEWRGGQWIKEQTRKKREKGEKRCQLGFILCFCASNFPWVVWVGSKPG
ncbi:hypothetical protein BD309DRAFT_965482 [Dichomitus squalens]|nr:hypothetical protein BD309DRAFT_965482 [Dichomitus squalens]